MQYKLPEHRIAQRPVHPPESAKMIQVNRENGSFSDKIFADLPAFLKKGDLLVFNQTKVIPSRIFGNCGEIPVEVFLVSKVSDGVWKCIGNPKKKIVKKGVVDFPLDIKGEVIASGTEREFTLQFADAVGTIVNDATLFKIGRMPIPPYIRGGKSDESDLVDYQTFWATQQGSVAAPTASLHFSKELVANIRESGVVIGEVTLHLGLDSIIVGADKNAEPAGERLVVTRRLVDDIAETRTRGGRIIAVGTSVVRSLETLARMEHLVEGEEVITKLYIRPPYEFKYCDAIITNFHMPDSTHIELVDAFIGNTPLLEDIYSHALTSDYRFLSYGDGMFIL